MNLKGVIIFTSGVAAGGLAATLFWREKYRQKYSKEADDKVASMLEYVNRLREEDKEGGLSSQKKYTAQSDLRDVDRSNGPSRREERVRVNYSEIYSQKHKAEEKLAGNEYPREESGDERIERETKMKDETKESPQIISATNYDTQYTWFDKATLLYYVEDDVLATDDFNDSVDDVEMLVGNTLEESGFKENEEDELFVRNFSRGTDYAVIKVYGAYADS